jgi:CheY-like chemotaxis protein
VLVIDDEPMLGAAIVRSLSAEHDTWRVGRAEEALARISSGERFDLILCDLMMPEMTGMDFYESVRAMYPDQTDRIVFLTGGAFTARARDFLEAVPNLRLDKTFDIQHLRAIVNERLK